MNITLMIGNGFDIGMGLKTGYMSFYEFFLGNCTEDNIIKKYLLEDKMNDNYNTWADLESALGENMKRLSMDEEDTFIEDKKEMEVLLISYLKDEERKIKFEVDMIIPWVEQALNSIREGNSKTESQLIKQVLDYYIGETYFYRAISFNYTNLCDKLFEIMKSKKPVIGRHNSSTAQYEERIYDVIHIHGTLYDGKMLLGVNDETQISNKELADKIRIKRRMIKPFLNNEIGDYTIEEVENVIKASGIICIYGMSMGKTDKMWWEKIGEWLSSAAPRLLIIFEYDDKYTGQEFIADKIEKREMVKDKFIAAANVSPEKAEKLKEKMVVYINKNIWEYTQEKIEDREIG
ncbi:MAG: AbiH family protein [Zhenhengia sp.]